MKIPHIFILTLVASFTLPGSSRAALVFSYEVTEAGHLLNGATVTSTATGDYTWESPAGLSASNQYAAVDEPWTTRISGATGPGAEWNGDYTFGGPTINLGVIWHSLGHLRLAAFSAPGTLIQPPIWTNGTNSFRFNIVSEGNGAPPADAAPVVFTDMDFSLGSFAKNLGTAPSFSNPLSGNASAVSTAVPESSSSLLLGLAGLSIALRRRRA